MTQAPPYEDEAATPETPQGQGSEKTRNTLLWVLFTVTALLGLVGLIRWPGALFDEYSPVHLVFRYTLAGSPLRADAVIAGAVAATGDSWGAVREDILLALWSVLALSVLLLVFLVTSAQFGLARARACFTSTSVACARPFGSSPSTMSTIESTPGIAAPPAAP